MIWWHCQCAHGHSLHTVEISEFDAREPACHGTIHSKGYSSMSVHDCTKVMVYNHNRNSGIVAHWRCTCTCIIIYTEFKLIEWWINNYYWWVTLVRIIPSPFQLACAVSFVVSAPPLVRESCSQPLNWEQTGQLELWVSSRGVWSWKLTQFHQKRSCNSHRMDPCWRGTCMDVIIIILLWWCHSGVYVPCTVD